MEREMLINTVEGQECRIGIVSPGGLEELYVERASAASQVGNIYKGRVMNVEPGIQAAFVDFGRERNGFLHISDLHPSYFAREKKGAEAVGCKRPHRVRPPIQECVRRGQEVVVQITKEGIGTKGPTLTTYLSIPGRLLVMMPGMTRLGVSRKVEDEGARSRARDVLNQLKFPPEIGFILRTAGVDRTKRDLQRDLNYLLRLWKSVKQRIKVSKAPAEIYQESDLVIRTVRDVYNSDIKRIVCDNEAVARKVRDFLNVIVPRTRHAIELYRGKEGLFYDYGLEHEIEQMHSRVMPLPGGGSLVFDQTEALVAIDVNSGRFRQHSDAETTALKIDLQAADEIARQLRLRDLGGVVIIDFIDMMEERNRRKLEKALRDAMKQDRAKTKVARISPFGIVELTRQRMRPSLKQAAFRRCEHCDGTGSVKSTESVALQVMRGIQRAFANDDVARVEVAVAPQVAEHLSNHQRHQIARLENEAGKSVLIKAGANLAAGGWQFTCTNRRGSVVAWERPEPTPAHRRELATVNIDEVPAPVPVPTTAPTGSEYEAEAVEAVDALLAIDPDESFIDEDMLDAEETERPALPARRPAAARANPRAEAKAAKRAEAIEDAEGEEVGDELEFGGEGEGGGESRDEVKAPREAAPPPAGEAGAEPGPVQPGGKKRTRRGRRGGRKHRHRREDEQDAQPGQDGGAPASRAGGQTPLPFAAELVAPEPGEPAAQPAGADEAEAHDEPRAEPVGDEPDEPGAPNGEARKRRRRGRRHRRGKGGANPNSGQGPQGDSPAQEVSSEPPPPR